MELAYKTIEMGDPRGKAKVYFSCHPDDVDRAFEGVTDDVLRHAACAIWYDAQPSSTVEELTAAEREEFLAILGDMQLVVIAVTARFLHSPSRARDLVLPHALERHIPVLPIMLDPGLEYEFNEVCAPIQVVNRQVTDPTATPYEEVLQSFLDAVLDRIDRSVSDDFKIFLDPVRSVGAPCEGGKAAIVKIEIMISIDLYVTLQDDLDITGDFRFAKGGCDDRPSRGICL